MKQLDYRQTPEEKLSIINDIFPILYKRFENLSERSDRAARKSKAYPYYAQMETTVQDSGKWIIYAVFMNKPTSSRGIYFQFHAFQTYTITNARNSQNNGLGLFHITAQGSQLNIEADEYPPHCINRMVQRLPEQHILYMDISGLTRFILKDNIQGALTLIRSNKTIHCGQVDVPTTVTSTPYGQFLGVSFSENYVCHLTFISNREMHLPQHAVNNFLDSLSTKVTDYKSLTNSQISQEQMDEILSGLGCDQMLDEAWQLISDESRDYSIAARITGHIDD